MARINANERPSAATKTQRQDHAPPKMRRAVDGDVIEADRAGLERIVVDESVQAAQGAKIAALDDIIAKRRRPGRGRPGTSAHPRRRARPTMGCCSASCSRAATRSSAASCSSPTRELAA